MRDQVSHQYKDRGILLDISLICRPMQQFEIMKNIPMCTTATTAMTTTAYATTVTVKPLNPELNLICYLLALLGAHHFLHVSRIRVKLLTCRLLMSYIYMEHPFLMFLDHTQRRSTVGRTPVDE